MYLLTAEVIQHSKMNDRSNSRALLRNIESDEMHEMLDLRLLQLQLSKNCQLSAFQMANTSIDL